MLIDVIPKGNGEYQVRFSEAVKIKGIEKTALFVEHVLKWNEHLEEIRKGNDGSE